MLTMIILRIAVISNSIIKQWGQTLVSIINFLKIMFFRTRTLPSLNILNMADSSKVLKGRFGHKKHMYNLS